MPRLLAGFLCATTLAATVSAATPSSAETLRYDPERPVPFGYHVEERPRYGLAITGAALTSVSAVCLVAGFAERERASTRHGESIGLGGPAILFVMGGLLGAVGLPLLVVGVSSKKKVLVSDGALELAPVLGRGFGGVGLSGTF